MTLILILIRITQALPGFQESLEEIKKGNEENATFTVHEKEKRAPKNKKYNEKLQRKIPVKKK